MGNKILVSYCRVSTNIQGKSGLGLEAQKTIINHFAKLEGKVVKQYVEVYSGTKLSECSELQNAIRYCNKIGGTLIIAKSDRFRSVSEALDIYDKLDGRLICCDIPNTDRFTLTLFWAIAEREAQLISIRTKAALKEKKRQGYKLGAANESYGKGEDYLQNKADGYEHRSINNVHKRLQSAELSIIIKAVDSVLPEIKKCKIKGIEYPFLGYCNFRKIKQDEWVKITKRIREYESISEKQFIEKLDFDVNYIKKQYYYIWQSRFKPIAEKYVKYELDNEESENE